MTKIEGFTQKSSTDPQNFKLPVHQHIILPFRDEDVSRIEQWL